MAGRGSTQAGQTPGSRERPARVPAARVVGRALSAAGEGCALRREPGQFETAPWNYLLERAQWLWLKHLKTLESMHSGRPALAQGRRPRFLPGMWTWLQKEVSVRLPRMLGNTLGRPSSGLSGWLVRKGESVSGLLLPPRATVWRCGPPSSCSLLSVTEIRASPTGGLASLCWRW